MLEKRYGEWTIIKESEKKGYALARCSCGSIREVLINNLKSGRSSSCGCKKRPLADFSTKNITVLYPIKEQEYMCFCNKCKQQVAIPEEKIRHRPNSCGCGLRKETVCANEIINGYKIIKILPTTSGKKRVLAKCLYCGKERILRISSLRNNRAICKCRT